MENMADRVHNTLVNCLYKEGENTDNMVVVEGIVRNFGFNPARITTHKAEIDTYIDELPEEFKQGWSFLNMCLDKHGHQWGEHINCEALTVLGIAAGRLEYCCPRELWSVLPGGMPYIQIKEEV